MPRYDPEPSYDPLKDRLIIAAMLLGTIAVLLLSLPAWNEAFVEPCPVSGRANVEPNGDE